MNMNFSRHFLIAMPNLSDPIFEGTLTFICDHNDKGAMGVIVNRPLGMTLSTLFEQINVELQRQDVLEQPVFFGGPAQTDRGFVLHTPLGEWQSTLTVSSEIGLTTSKDVLLAVGDGQGPEKLFVTLGYAGWEPGQLEKEVSKNAWLSVEADPEIIFRLPPKERYNAALKLGGIPDICQLSPEVGHA